MTMKIVLNLNAISAGEEKYLLIFEIEWRERGR